MDPNKRRLRGAHRRRPQLVRGRPPATRGPLRAMRSPLELRPGSHQIYPVRPERRPPRTRVGKGSRAVVDRDA